MSDYQPKVGDRVMVGEHGPYEARQQVSGRYVILDVGAGDYVGEADPAWLTPAPEPEPDEPTAPGALVRDGAGRYLTRGGKAAGRWYGPSVQGWAYIERPITVILNDPAEVETLREHLRHATNDRDDDA